MLLQAVILCGFLEIDIISFYFLPGISQFFFGNKIIIQTNIVLNCIFILNICIQPIVYFCFNRKAYHEMLKMISCCPGICITRKY